MKIGSPFCVLGACLVVHVYAENEKYILICCSLLGVAVRKCAPDGDGNCKGDEAARHDYPEEAEVAECLLDVAGKHSGQSETEEHESRADGEMRRLVRAVRHVDHIEHARRVTQSVAELLKAYAQAEQPHGCRLEGGEEHIDKAGQGEEQRHGDDGFFQTCAARPNAAADAADEHQNDADARHLADHIDCDTQSAFRLRGEEERIA